MLLLLCCFSADWHAWRMCLIICVLNAHGSCHNTLHAKTIRVAKAQNLRSDTRPHCYPNAATARCAIDPACCDQNGHIVTSCNTCNQAWRNPPCRIQPNHPRHFAGRYHGQDDGSAYSLWTVSRTHWTRCSSGTARFGASVLRTSLAKASVTTRRTSLARWRTSGAVWPTAERSSLTDFGAVCMAMSP